MCKQDARAKVAFLFTYIDSIIFESFLEGKENSVGLVFANNIGGGSKHTVSRLAFVGLRRLCELEESLEYVCPTVLYKALALRFEISIPTKANSRLTSFIVLAGNFGNRIANLVAYGSVRLAA